MKVMTAIILMTLLSSGLYAQNIMPEKFPEDLGYPLNKEFFLQREGISITYENSYVETGIYYFGKKYALTINGEPTGKTLKEILERILERRKKTYFVSSRGLFYYFIHGQNECIVHPVDYGINCVKIKNKEIKQ